MIIDYDHNPALTTDQKLQSLKESVQMALNELEANNAPEQKNSLAKTIIENYTGSTLAGTAQSVKSAIDSISSRFASYVPTSRKVNSKALSSDISLTASDVSAVAKSGDTMTGDLILHKSDTAARTLRVSNSLGDVRLIAADSGNHGVWSSTKAKWIIYCGTGGDVYSNGTQIPASATLLTDSASSVTATKVGNYYSGIGITAMKNGGCVTVQVAFTASTTFSGLTTIATIPVGYRPITRVFGYRNGTTEYFIVESNGDVKFNSLTSGSTYYGVATYCKA